MKGYVSSNAVLTIRPLSDEMCSEKPSFLVMKSYGAQNSHRSGQKPLDVLRKGNMQHYYGRLAAIFEDNLCRLHLLRDVRRHSQVLLGIISKMNAEKEGFADTVRLVVKQKILVRYWREAVLVSGILYTLLDLWWHPTDSREQGLLTFAKFLIPFFMGIGLASICHLSPSSNDLEKVESFLKSLVEVLWAVAKHENGKTYTSFPKEVIQLLLGMWSLDEFEKKVDAMLVSFALEVKLLEEKRTNSDPELMSKQRRWRFVHAEAVKLCIAETNPETYKERAKPASAVPVEAN